MDNSLFFGEVLMSVNKYFIKLDIYFDEVME